MEIRELQISKDKKQSPGKVRTRDQETWLIVSYFSNSDGIPASHHIDDRARALRSLGVKAMMLSSIGTLHSDSPYVRRYTVISVAPAGWWYELRRFLKFTLGDQSKLRKITQGIVSIIALPLCAIESLLTRTPNTWSWSISSSIAALCLAARHRPNIIYTSGGPSSCHVAGTACARLLKIPWIAELQDPIVLEERTTVFNTSWFNHLIESWIAKYASGAIFLTKAAEESFCKRNSVIGKTTTIQPGADAGAKDKSSNVACNGHLTFMHAGSLQGTRNLNGFMRGMDLFLTKRPEACGKLRIILAGSHSSDVDRVVSHLKVKVEITNLGQVPRTDALLAMEEADVLLVLQHHDPISSETIPSKTYEYLITGKPMICLTFRNPELEDMLRRYGQRVAETDDPESISCILGEVYDDWVDGKLSERHPKAVPTTDDAATNLREWVINLSRS